MEEGKVVRAGPFPANQQSAEAIVPGVGALDDPATRPTPYPAQQGLLAAAADVRRDPARSNGGLGVLEVIALVEAQVMGSARAARGTQDHGIERLGDEPLVVDVGAGNLSGQRDAAAIGEDVAFHATFGAIRRVRAREVPPFGAFTMALSSEDHFHWMPRLWS